MTSNRRSFLKQAAATVAVSAVAGCAPDRDASPTGRTLDDPLLAALGDAILPDSLGSEGRKSATAAFRAWIGAYTPVSEEMHGYGNAEITFTPPDPAPGWNAQLAALELLAKRSHRDGFTALSVAERRALVRSSLRHHRGEQLPSNPLAASHIAVALLAHWASSSAASDLAWGARIGRGNCRSLADAPRKPLPVAGGGRS